MRKPSWNRNRHRLIKQIQSITLYKFGAFCVCYSWHSGIVRKPCLRACLRVYIWTELLSICWRFWWWWCAYTSRSIWRVIEWHSSKWHFLFVRFRVWHKIQWREWWTQSERRNVWKSVLFFLVRITHFNKLKNAEIIVTNIFFYFDSLAQRKRENWGLWHTHTPT